MAIDLASNRGRITRLFAGWIRGIVHVDAVANHILQATGSNCDVIFSVAVCRGGRSGCTNEIGGF